MAGETVDANGVAVAAPASTDITVTLKKPVMANGEMVSKLVFKEPTGNDMVMIGEHWPVNIDQNDVLSPNPAVMAGVMSTLATVPPSTIRGMSAIDFSTCAWGLMRFFVPDVRAIT